MFSLFSVQRRWGLSAKLTLAYSLLSALMAGSLSIGLYWQLKNSQIAAMRDRLQDTLSLAAPQIDGDYHTLIFDADDIQTPYFEINQQRLQALQTINPAIRRISTLRQDGTGQLLWVHDLQRYPLHRDPVLQSKSAGALIRTPFSPPRPEMLERLMAPLSQPVVEMEVIPTEEGDSILYGYAPILDRFQQQEGILLIELDVAVVMENVAQAKTLAIQTFAIAIVFSMLVIWLLTQHLVIVPTLELTRATQLLSSGEWSCPLPIARTDELGVLAQNFNQMSEQLKASFATLEQRVAERTAELSVEKDKVEVASQAKSTFIATMSHELKTPLNAILGFSQLLGQDASLPEKHRKKLEIISRSGEHLLDLVNDVLEMSKAEAGRTRLNLRVFDLPAMLTALCDMLQLKAASKGIGLQLHCSSVLPRLVETDEGKLRQILLNLLGNALKFTHQGQIVLDVSLVEEPGRLPAQERAGGAEAVMMNASMTSRLLFCVTDMGEGIDPVELETLFQPFTQTRSGRDSLEGTGLGLCISQNFAHLLGGQMWVESRLGEGTQVSFEIQVQHTLMQHTVMEVSLPGAGCQADCDRPVELPPLPTLASLPESLRQNINGAAQELDETLLRERINQLRANYPDLAQTLAARLDALDFDGIIRLTEV